jgi:hypothetical protein
MNPNVVIFPPNDEELVAIQQEIGGALRLSLEAFTREPLPEHVAFLLYRLDVADRPKPRSQNDCNSADPLPLNQNS